MFSGFRAVFLAHYIKYWYSAHPLSSTISLKSLHCSQIHSPELKCGQSSDWRLRREHASAESFLGLNRTTAVGHWTYFCAPRRESKRRERGWRGFRKDKKKKIRHKTGIKLNIAQSYCQIPNDREVKETYWRTCYIISLWRHAGDDKRCQKPEGRCCLFIRTEKVIEEIKQSNVSVRVTRLIKEK